MKRDGLVREALELSPRSRRKHYRIPAGKVLVAVKRFNKNVHGELYGYFSNKVWHTPVGHWSQKREPLKMCVSGWHVSTPTWMCHYLGRKVFIVEVRGRIAADALKACATQVRLVREIPNDLSSVTARMALDAYIAEANAANVKPAKRKASR